MTALAERHAAEWSIMPGWGVVADLTPPELGAARALRRLKRGLAGALVAVLLLCIGGYLLASRGHSGAENDLTNANATTATLTVTQHRYDKVTHIDAATAGMNAQLSTLLSTDVDVSSLVNQLYATLPKNMTLTSINITVGATAGAGAITTGATQSVGSISLSGTSKRFVDLAAYASALSRLRGITAVVPSSNSVQDGKGTWTATAQLTEARYSHRYTAPAVPASPASPTGGTR